MMTGEAMSLLSNLQRYAGWLPKDHASIAVRAGVSELAAAMQAGTEAADCLMVLDKDIKRLHGGGIRTMLRRACGELQDVLAKNGTNGDGETGS